MISPNSPIQYQFVGHQVILRIRNRVCETADELFASELFRDVLRHFVKELLRKDSPLLSLFELPQGQTVTESDLDQLIRVLQLLAKMPADFVTRLLDEDQRFISKPILLSEFIEQLYDYWREFERFIVCDSEGDALDKRPYRTFNETIETLNHLVRSVYREVQENISGRHPQIYRQVIAGAEVAVIALPKTIPQPSECCHKLDGIGIIRQVLMYPPLLIQPPTNKRSGQFVRVAHNPLDALQVDANEWLCYPAKVGPLLILIYFHQEFYELGFALSNLFELAEDEILNRKADAIFLFGVNEECIDPTADYPTQFYEDLENGLLVGAIPRRKEYAYFGYLKKMALTLHNIVMMKRGNLPYHGAMVRFLLKNGKETTILIMGDTGTGKSETLEAFRASGEDYIRQMVIIADDMGSLQLNSDHTILGYGTEIGAFVRLDDLHPGYAFGHLDRTIIMSPGQVNARVVLPVTSYNNIVRGFPVDMVLYANNYEEVDAEHAVIEAFPSASAALEVFRRGIAMSKGTTTSTGLVQSYFTNIFGPPQYQSLHDQLAERFFQAFFENKIFVGQLRTRLGLPGWEQKGPAEAAQALLQKFQQGL